MTMLAALLFWAAWSVCGSLAPAQAKQERDLSATTVSLHDHHSLGHDNVRLKDFVEKINVGIDPVVDADLEHLASAFHAGNFCPFYQKVITKLAKNEPIDVVIVGGSVTYGAELRNRLQDRWSNSFDQLLNSKWYNGTFRVNNIAVGACNVDSWIARVNRLPTADLIIVDLSVNDQGFDVQVLPHFYRTFIQLLDDLPSHPALLFNLAFRSAQNRPEELATHCPAANQSISCCGGATFFCKRWWDMSEYVAVVLKEFRVPYVSYKELVWPDYWSPPPTLNAFWNGLSHPDAKAHRLLAKLIAMGVYLNIKGASKHHSECSASDNKKLLQYVRQEQRDSSIQPLCTPTTSLLSNMFATDQASSQQSFSLAAPAGEQWTFFADRPNKFGFILQATSCSKNALDCQRTLPQRTLSLEIHVGEDPVVQIFYLKSFAEEMGAVSVWIDDRSDAATVLDGKWNLRTDGFLAFDDSYKVPYSVTRVATLSASALEHVSSYVKGDHYLLPGLSAGKHVLHFAAKTVEAEKLKFKLLGVSSC